MCDKKKRFTNLRIIIQSEINRLPQSVIGMQSETEFIAKYGKYYNMWQEVTISCDRYYKVWQLQSET